MIDWSNPRQKISEYFTVKEALWLHSWKRMATESDGLNEDVKINLLDLFSKMDFVRSFLQKPIVVHSAYRPKEYNIEIGGATYSAHILGKAVDWDCGESCDITRVKVLPKLWTLNMRMEKNKGSNWVHLDTMEVPEGGNRYFIP